MHRSMVVRVQYEQDAITMIKIAGQPHHVKIAINSTPEYYIVHCYRYVKTATSYY